MLNFENFDQKIFAEKPIALIVFTAQWCKPSKLQQEILPQLKQEFSQVMIEIIDVDQHEKLADRFNARTLPTSVIFAQGEIVEVLPGYQTLDFLQSYLSHIIKQVEEMKEAEKND